MDRTIIDFGYDDLVENTLHQIITYCRRQEQIEGTGKKCLDEIFKDTPDKAKSFYPLIDDLGAEYILNII